MNDNYSMPSFSFSYEHGGKQVNISFETETWTEALEEFTSFISASFGYSIKDQVALKANKYRINSEVWSGPVFDGEEYSKQMDLF